MAFLVLNGVTVPVSADGVSLAHAAVGSEAERSPAGVLAGGPNTTKREWSMTTIPLPASELDAWVGLIEGKGHTWAFDSELHSKRGRAVASGTGTLVSGGAVWGASLLRLSVGASISWATQFLPLAWTLLVWRKESGVWKHYVVRSDGFRWENGNFFVGNPLGIAVTGGSVTLSGLSGLTDFDDLVALPYAVPSAWAPLLYARHAATAWTALPRIHAAGDFGGASSTWRGRVTDSRAVRCVLNGVLTTGYVLEFNLREI
jgi:hypothetical protein